MLFLPGWWGLGQPVAIVFVASPYLVVLGFFLAIIGHVLNWQRRARSKLGHPTIKLGK
jgi:hypothetical protein